MFVWSVVASLFLFACVGYFRGRARAFSYVSDQRVLKLASLPFHYGTFVALSILVPGALLIALWCFLVDWILVDRLLHAFSREIAEISSLDLIVLLDHVRVFSDREGGAIPTDPLLIQAVEQYTRDRSIMRIALCGVLLIQGLICLLCSLSMIKPAMNARIYTERFVRFLLIVSSSVAIFTTFGIVLSLLGESFRFFRMVSVWEFLFGFHWNPHSISEFEGVLVVGKFGAVPLFVGTALITLITMSVSVPIGLMSAIYLADYAGVWVGAIVRPILELLAGIPTVVYGFFAALVIAPSIRDAGVSLGLGVSAESALAAGLVMGIMIIPFISSLSYDALRSVPQSLRDGAAALGATRSEMILRVILPAAMPGISGALLLAISRAVGETMIVVMAAGLAPNLTLNPLESVTTMTVQIVALLSGDQEFDSPQTLSAFALSLVLFFITLFFNVLALRILRKYRGRCCD